MYITPFCSVRDGQRVCSSKQKLPRRAWSLCHEIFRKAAHNFEEQNSGYFESFLKTLFFFSKCKVIWTPDLDQPVWKQDNQRANGPVKVLLISGPSTKHTKPV